MIELLKTALATAYLMTAAVPVQYGPPPPDYYYQGFPGYGPRIYSDPRGGPMMPVPAPPPERYMPPVGPMGVPNRLPAPPYYQEYRRFRDCDPRAYRC